MSSALSRSRVVSFIVVSHRFMKPVASGVAEPSSEKVARSRLLVYARTRMPSSFAQVA